MDLPLLAGILDRSMLTPPAIDTPIGRTFRGRTQAMTLGSIVAIGTPAPSGEMLAYGIRFAGLDVLSERQIREGMALCVDILNEHCWGRDLRRPVAALSKYGGNAKEYIPQLREVRAATIAKDRNWEKNEDRKREVAALDKLTTQIESDGNPPKLWSMAEFIRAPGR